MGAGIFFRAAAYPTPHKTGGLVRERAADSTFEWSERHLHCIWYDANLRPRDLRSLDGEKVNVEHPGAWNLEAGPDFLGAAWRVGRGQRRMEGDVEVHIRPSDWQGHGHANDPRYARVRLHLTYYPGPPAAGLPPGSVTVPLQPVLAKSPGFSFDVIDLAAYPYASKGEETPCRRLLEGWSRQARARLLDAAGEERLRRKALRLAAVVEKYGPEQALYAEILSALGYKHNKQACRRLAEALPVADLREEANGDSVIAYALLLGVGGLLPSRSNPDWGPLTRRYMRALWDAWWPRQGILGERSLPASAWRLDGLRPANHPRRRLAAAAQWFTGTHDLSGHVFDCARRRPLTFGREMTRWFETPGQGYWARRLTFGDDMLSRPVALLGRSRAASIVSNVLVPFAAGLADGADPRLTANLPPGGGNALVRRAAHVFFGPRHNPALYRDELRRQGLIQIFQDFCLNDRTRCRSCRLLRALEENYAG